MPNPADRLRAIKTFAELTRYLEDELDWPLERYGFEDLTFEYTPAEVGLKDEDAAKVKAIHQLRPFQQDQPWGIFFVEFENKRMPVVVLRRILSHLVLKQRASANKAKAAAWHMDDLLFISAFGEAANDQREIAFAHFHQETGDLPTLRVLGWDGADTGLKLDHVAATLHERLRWPSDPSDTAAWREQWSPAFRLRLGHVIRTANALAERLATLARGIRDAARTLIDHEAENGPLRRLHKAFQTALIHDLSEADFADTYAQTITYGLLTAAISRTDMDGGRYGTVLIAQNVTDMVPITNPFLREMLQTFLQAGGRQGGINFDELGIQDVVELLRGDETDLPAILDDFGNRTRGEDPVIHFYEHFLAAYDKQLKVKRGIFYTPQPVVSYIVRSVHELLQTEFGLVDGLAATTTWGAMAKRLPGLKVPEGTDPASPFVVILDPATGTATFLVEVIDVIHRTLIARWEAQHLNASQQHDAWNDYVPQHLLPRLYGYELMMAPYAIAHMKIGLKLFETGYRFGSVERVRVYLTNSLEPASDGGDQLAFAGWSPALAHEAQAVNAVKRYQRFTVVIGNPPYAGISSNMTEYAQQLVNAYKIVDGKALNERKLWLQDDYVKFIRTAQTSIDQANIGILGYITNHGYLDNPTFRGMRQSLLGTFQRVNVLDLHGNTTKKEQSPDGIEDKNVFDIRQGVAICLAVRIGIVAAVRHAEIWGSREAKYAWLTTHSISNTAFASLSPNSPFYFFDPQNMDFRAEYEEGWRITEVMPNSTTGFVTARDHFVVGFSESELLERMSEFANRSVSDVDIRSRYFAGRGSSKYDGGDSRGWKLPEARRRVQADARWKNRVVDCLYRPFDCRKIYWCDWMIDWPRPEVTRHLLAGKNLGINIGRAGQVIDQGPWDIIFCTRSVTEFNLFRRGGNSLFPLWLYQDHADPKMNMGSDEYRQVNIEPTFLRGLAQRFDLPSAGPCGVPQGLTPEDILRYAYAVFHSPDYRTRYAEFLKTDFPRLPLTNRLELFRCLSMLGGELIALHLMESSMLTHHITTYIGQVNPEVEKISFDNDSVWLDKAQTRGFRGVPEAVWVFHIGGYQVCEKWLKDRKGRTLSAEDIEHYQRIVVALHETIRIMGEIDEVIEAHGGWPIK